MDMKKDENPPALSNPAMLETVYTSPRTPRNIPARHSVKSNLWSRINHVRKLGGVMAAFQKPKSQAEKDAELKEKMLEDLELATKAEAHRIMMRVNETVESYSALPDCDIVVDRAKIDKLSFSDCVEELEGLTQWFHEAPRGDDPILEAYISEHMGTEDDDTLSLKELLECMPKPERNVSVVTAYHDRVVELLQEDIQKLRVDCIAMKRFENELMKTKARLSEALEESNRLRTQAERQVDPVIMNDMRARMKDLQTEISRLNVEIGTKQHKFDAEKRELELELISLRKVVGNVGPPVDAQKEVKELQEKLRSIRYNYELRISELEDSRDTAEKEFRAQLEVKDAELQELVQKQNKRSDADLNSLRQKIDVLGNSIRVDDLQDFLLGSKPLNALVKRMSRFTDMGDSEVADLRAKLVSVKHELGEVRRDCKSWNQKYEDLAFTHEATKTKLENELNETQMTLNEEIKNLKDHLGRQQQEAESEVRQLQTSFSEELDKVKKAHHKEVSVLQDFSHQPKQRTTGAQEVQTEDVFSNYVERKVHADLLMRCRQLEELIRQKTQELDTCKQTHAEEASQQRESILRLKKRLDELAHTNRQQIQVIEKFLELQAETVALKTEVLADGTIQSNDGIVADMNLVLIRNRYQDAIKGMHRVKDMAKRQIERLEAEHMKDVERALRQQEVERSNLQESYRRIRMANMKMKSLLQKNGIEVNVADFEAGDGNTGDGNTDSPAQGADTSSEESDTNGDIGHDSADQACDAGHAAEHVAGTSTPHRDAESSIPGPSRATPQPAISDELNESFPDLIHTDMTRSVGVQTILTPEAGAGSSDQRPENSPASTGPGRPGTGKLGSSVEDDTLIAKAATPAQADINGVEPSSQKPAMTPSVQGNPEASTETQSDFHWNPFHVIKEYKAGNVEASAPGAVSVLIAETLLYDLTKAASVPTTQHKKTDSVHPNRSPQRASGVQKAEKRASPKPSRPRSGTPSREKQVRGKTSVSTPPSAESDRGVEKKPLKKIRDSSLRLRKQGSQASTPEQSPRQGSDSPRQHAISETLLIEENPKGRGVSAPSTPLAASLPLTSTEPCTPTTETVGAKPKAGDQEVSGRPATVDHANLKHAGGRGDVHSGGGVSMDGVYAKESLSAFLVQLEEAEASRSPAAHAASPAVEFSRVWQQHSTSTSPKRSRPTTVERRASKASSVDSDLVVTPTSLQTRAQEFAAGTAKEITSDSPMDVSLGSDAMSIQASLGNQATQGSSHRSSQVSLTEDEEHVSEPLLGQCLTQSSAQSPREDGFSRTDAKAVVAQLNHTHNLALNQIRLKHRRQVSVLQRQLADMVRRAGHQAVSRPKPPKPTRPNRPGRTPASGMRSGSRRGSDGNAQLASATRSLQRANSRRPSSAGSIGGYYRDRSDLGIRDLAGENAFLIEEVERLGARLYDAELALDAEQHKRRAEAEEEKQPATRNPLPPDSARIQSLYSDVDSMYQRLREVKSHFEQKIKTMEKKHDDVKCSLQQMVTKLQSELQQKVLMSRANGKEKQAPHSHSDAGDQHSNAQLKELREQKDQHFDCVSTLHEQLVKLKREIEGVFHDLQIIRSEDILINNAKAPYSGERTVESIVRQDIDLLEAIADMLHQARGKPVRPLYHDGVLRGDSSLSPERVHRFVYHSRAETAPSSLESCHIKKVVLSVGDGRETLKASYVPNVPSFVRTRTNSTTEKRQSRNTANIPRSSTLTSVPQSRTHDVRSESNGPAPVCRTVETADKTPLVPLKNMPESPQHKDEQQVLPTPQAKSGSCAVNAPVDNACKLPLETNAIEGSSGVNASPAVTTGLPLTFSLPTLSSRTMPSKSFKLPAHKTEPGMRPQSTRPQDKLVGRNKANQLQDQFSVKGRMPGKYRRAAMEKLSKTLANDGIELEGLSTEDDLQVKERIRSELGSIMGYSTKESRKQNLGAWQLNSVAGPPGYSPSVTGSRQRSSPPRVMKPSSTGTSLQVQPSCPIQHQATLSPRSFVALPPSVSTPHSSNPSQGLRGRRKITTAPFPRKDGDSSGDEKRSTCADKSPKNVTSKDRELSRKLLLAHEPTPQPPTNSSETDTRLSYTKSAPVGQFSFSDDEDDVPQDNVPLLSTVLSDVQREYGEPAQPMDSTLSQTLNSMLNMKKDISDTGAPDDYKRAVSFQPISAKSSIPHEGLPKQRPQLSGSIVKEDDIRVSAGTNE
eukprot:Rmarinus@m.2395